MSPQPARTPSGVRPRYPRIAAAGSSLLVMLVALLGAAGVLPVDGGRQMAYAGTIQTQSATSVQQSTGIVGMVDVALARIGGYPAAAEDDAPRISPDVKKRALPNDSGRGKRVVFDMSEQWVWLVGAEGTVVRDYPVSGSLTDNLGPGTYAVYSRSRHAVGIDDSGTMQYMVRFTQGENAAIGFHDIPVHDGEKVQTTKQLGTPQSHGCIRQWRPDAKALWAFAPVGTTVVVLD